jgi:aminopeptidase N
MNRFRSAFLGTFGFASLALAAGTGSASLNDSLYPWMGNGGYDAQQYTIDLRISADHKSIKGITVMEAIASEDLSSFNLDLGKLVVKYVLVNGVKASFEHQDPELTVTPESEIGKGSSFRVQVAYEGEPGTDAEQLGEFGTGWYARPSSAIGLAEPSALLSWAAVNDSPKDKARFSFRLTAPITEQAVANGVFLGRRENADGTATSFYRISELTTTYMPMVAFGQYERVEGGNINGVRIRHYLGANTKAYYQPVIAQTADMIRFFADKLGPYPFKEYGIITHDYEVGFALENQTLSSFPIDFGYEEGTDPKEIETDLAMVYAHELSHQWFAGLVSFDDNSQTFIHEGFAQYLGDLWREHKYGIKVDDTVRDNYGYMLFARQGGYFSLTKAAIIDLLNNNLKKDARFDATQTGQALDLMFYGKLPAPTREEIVGRAANGLSMPEFVAEIEKLEFTKLAYLRKDIREVRRLADPKLASVMPLPPPGKVVRGDDPFNGNVYSRGEAALVALRYKVGEASFFQMMRTFLERHKFATANNEDFLAVVAELGGAEARALLERWLFDEQVPDFPELGLAPKDYLLGADLK